MKLNYTIKTALRALKTNKSRAALTILGIVIGITSIMLIMSLGQGAQNLILSQLQTGGSKTIYVSPGREPKGPSDMAQSLGDSLKEKDLIALQNKANVPTAEKVEGLAIGATTA